ncbi:MAG: energy transducer TonB [Marinicellaceae bacterium]
MSQEDTDTDKPSWSEDLPEKLETPEINLEPTVDTSIEFDRDDLGMSREDIFNDSEESPDSDDVNLDLQSDKAAAEQAAAEQAAADKAAADKAAAEQAAAEQAAAEQAAAEQAAAEQAAADLAAAEQAAADLAAAEQAAEEQAAAEQAAADLAAAEQVTIDSNSQSSDIIEPSGDSENVNYEWKQINRSKTNYPLRAARSGEEGWVDVEVEINPYGEVVSARVVRSYRNSRTFHRAATDTAKSWLFDPPIEYGIEVNQLKTFKVLFKL